MINYSSGAEAAGETVKHIGSDKAFAVKADAGSVKAIEEMVDAVITKYGALDIVIACAGIMKLNELEKVTETEYDAMMALNVKGPLFLAQVSFSLYFGN